MSAKRKSKPTTTELELIAGLYRLLQSYQGLYNEKLCSQIGECREGACPLFGERYDGSNGCLWNDINDQPFMDMLEQYLEDNYNRDDQHLIEHDRPYLERY